MDEQLATILNDSLRFAYHSGGVTPVRQPHSTGWRVLPGLMCSQIRGCRDRIVLADGAEIPVPAGSLMLLAGGIRHRVDLVSAAGLARWVHVNYYVLEKVDLFSLFAVPPVVPPPVSTAVGDLIEAWIGTSQRLRHTPLRLHAERQAFGFRLLALLADLLRPRPQALERMALRERLAPVLEHLHRHLSEPLRRDALARLANLSPAQFHRVFRTATGSAPLAYLWQLRLRHAQQRLLTTALPVAAIAAECGYEDVFVFSKRFTRAAGLAPSAYRASLQELRHCETAEHRTPDRGS